MTGELRGWLAPEPPGGSTSPAEPTPPERRLVRVELLIVLGVTMALSATRSALSLVDSLLRPERLPDQKVALNAPAAANQFVDLAFQLTHVAQLTGWGALGGYLIVRAGLTLRDIGLDRTHLGRDALGAAGLAALIGIPGLGLYLVAHAVGANLTVLPSTLTDTWWRLPVLIASAAGNAFAEEVLLTGYLLTRLRQLGRSENFSVAASAVLRGCYHLYQGFGGFVGNVVMGLVFGRVWQRTGRLWALFGAHLLLDVVSFVGFTLLAGKVSWLPVR
ncbi:MAG: CPBP family intramembrane glutamic endopeptidase [Pseudonocardia sp.]